MTNKSRKTTKKGMRTSTEVAAAAPTHNNVPKTTEIWEAIGELPTPYSLPPAEPLPARRIPKNPIVAAASDTALSAKWGMADYEWLVDTGGSRRVTRTYAHAVRDKSSDGVLPRDDESASNSGGVALSDGLTTRTTHEAYKNTLQELDKEERPVGCPLEVTLRVKDGCVLHPVRPTSEPPVPTYEPPYELPVSDPIPTSSI
ncbi:uncharacterized protein TRAVEDRAFT_54073 [Trametes versicolor FP-101664 SS1]|uniref:Uncharacterized protein n=1 Tax=Trametes versicolor (strain FP-101664) TaxID=717944 RepID=R7S7S9_TRAVS|nr:uncharacterized protein TRAVEDRAFT_54073 [Trametes versicolor FP-101664 SS1]EIW52098.1 hypothetical protein TRAVEDRAFT_54073 [Trametes versicolor FP-101664 SS1]